jgi:hypothetical protein
MTASPWSVEDVNQKRLAGIQVHHHQGFTVGIVDSTFLHHPRGQTIYGVYTYWDDVEHRSTDALQLVTAALSTQDRLDGFDDRSSHRDVEEQERLY